MRATGPAPASGAVAFTLVWVGAVAVVTIASILIFGPMIGGLGCPGGCPDDPLLLRVLRAAVVVVVAFAAFTAIVLALMAAARRTRFAAIGLGIVGAALLSPTMLALIDLVRGEAGIGWPAVLFVGLGVPGVVLLYAAWLVWRAATVSRASAT